MFKFIILDLQQKIVKKTAENHMRFYFTYMQLSRLQSLEKISLLEPISLKSVNNQLHYQLQAEDKQLQRLRDIPSLSFANATAQKQHVYSESHHGTIAIYVTEGVMNN